MKKKFLALVLTLAMVLSLVPVTALAEEGTSEVPTNTVYVVASGKESGDGTESNPFQTIQDAVSYIEKQQKSESTNATPTTEAGNDIVEGIKNALNDYGTAGQIIEINAPAQEIFTMAKNAIVISDYVDAGDLKITKTVSNNEADNTEFSFTVKLTRPATESTTDDTDTSERPLNRYYDVIMADGTTQTQKLNNGELTVTMKNGQSVTIKDLLPGTQFTVTEANNALYTSTDTGATGVIAAKETQIAAFTNTYTPKWTISKSKTATNLDSNYESKVTLSLPSAEEKLDSDIVFVLDKSTSVQLENQALEMLNALKGQADKTGAKIKVGVVIFNKIANVTEWKDLETKYDEIKAAIEQNIQGGSNIHAGLLAAKKMLDEDTDVAANRKYMILVSDGVTYQFCHNSNYEKAWTRSFNGELHADKVNQCGTLTELNVQYDNAETGIPQNSISAWMTDIQNRMNNGKDCEETYDYEYTGNAPTGTSQLLPEKEYISNVEKALYLTKNTYEELSTSYNCYAILARETRPWGTDFMHLLAGGSTLNFESVQNNILYLVAAGSKVEDYMGYTSDYNFNFINDASKLTITVGKGDAQEKLDAVKIDNNHYGFGPVTVETDSSDKVTTYRYNLEYIPGNMTDTEHFVWRINVPVENLAPVALTYSVKLVNPKSASGTYGQYDEDGSKKYSGLYTNNSATLHPKDSNENWGIPENFLKPTVSYTVSGGSGGNHKPTVTIPDDVPTGLDLKNHYGYIIGYPVDYYTGKPTTDQTKKPVRPEGKITRAEVATIYFRMLTDENRAANWNQVSGFSDVKNSAWYNNAISTLTKAGILKGYEDGTFQPNGYITRAEFATIAIRFFSGVYEGEDLFPDIKGHWAEDYINNAANKGLVKGYEDGTFGPDRYITRAEAVTLVNRTLNRHPHNDGLHKDMLVWPDNMDTSKWYYADMQEATNSHEPDKNKSTADKEYWGKMLPIRDWEALEKEWSNANSAPGEGEVV